jgi:hypothetical protein
VSTLLATVLEFIALLLFNRFDLNYIPSGPLALVFSLLYQHYTIVPASYQFRIFGMPLTNKSFNYLLALQVKCCLNSINSVLTFELACIWSPPRICRRCDNWSHFRPTIPLRAVQFQRLPPTTLPYTVFCALCAPAYWFSSASSSFQPRVSRGRAGAFQ